VRLLSKEEFGIWALFTTVTTLIEMARNGLVKNGFVRSIISSPKEKIPEVITASFVLNGILTIISVLILIILSYFLSVEWNSPALKPMFIYYIFTTLFLLPYFHLQFIEQANFKFEGLFFSTLTRAGFHFSYIAFSFIFTYEITLVSLSQFMMISAIAGTVVVYFITKKYLLFSKTINWDIIKELFNYGKYVFGTAISSQLLRSVDQLMLGSMVTTASVASYNVAIRISNLVEVPTATIATIIFPKSAESMAKGGKPEAKRLYEKSVGAILAVLFPVLIFVLAFPEFIITLVASKGYLDTVSILQVTILYSIFTPFGRQFGTILDSIGKPKITFSIVLLNLVLNIISNYIFINAFGVIGAAYGTLVSCIIGFL